MTHTPKVFLIVYDRASKKLVTFREFDYASRDEAQKERFKIELEAAHSGSKIEAVILVANSEEELKSSHSGYFQNVTTIVTSTSSTPTI
ncbi:MAG TPA: hypothetical protein VII69_07135 [Candidatus Eremiobacteraceae bacterium]